MTVRVMFPILFVLAGCRSLLGFEEAIVVDVAAAPRLGFEQPETTANEASGTLAIAVVLSAPASAPVTARYAITGGSATAGADYRQSDSDVLVFSPGETRKVVEVEILRDGIAEPVEDIELEVTSVDGAELDVARLHRVTIEARPVISWKGTMLTQLEASIDLGLEVSIDPSDQPVTFALSVSGTAGSADFDLNTSSPVTLPAGTTFTEISVLIKQDPIIEQEETVLLKLQDATNAIVAPMDEFTLTIVDDD